VARVPSKPSETVGASQKEELVGLVVGVADGDTITVLDKEEASYSIRLAGIDAPEKRQAFGNTSRHNLATLVAGKVVSVEWHKLDVHKRIVGKVLLNGSDIGLEQIRVGLAWHYKQFANEQSTAERQAYAEVELQARAERRGLWHDASPIPPWNFRHNKSVLLPAGPSPVVRDSVHGPSY
jgi:endonuclease YncB( thermonuclease family)